MSLCRQFSIIGAVGNGAIQRNLRQGRGAGVRALVEAEIALERSHQPLAQPAIPFDFAEDPDVQQCVALIRSEPARRAAVEEAEAKKIADAAEAASALAAAAGMWLWWTLVV
jgi:hypothetical protein